MNMKAILNNPELLRELDKAYELAAPYRELTQYRLAIINLCTTYFGGEHQVIRHQAYFNGWPTLVIDAGNQTVNMFLME